MRILSGIQPSGKLHLGNYFGAIAQFLSYQDQNSPDKPLYFIADLHALTTVRDGAALRQHTLDVALDYLALGLDPKRSILFKQSDLQHPLLAWILSTVTPVALLERGHSYKDKLQKGLSPDAGLLTYPVLMAADILLYGADFVPVGKDQTQHLEFTRDICTKFNVTYVPGYKPEDPTGKECGVPGILKIPDALILENVAVIPGLDGLKMSKSYNNIIEIFADEAALRKKVMGMKTDSSPVEAPKPADSPLLALLALLAGPGEAAEHAASWAQGGVGYGTYKKRLVELVLERFLEARKRRAELEKDPGYVHRVLAEGASAAREVSRPYMERVLAVTGLGQAAAVQLRVIW